MKNRGCLIALCFGFICWSGAAEAARSYAALEPLVVDLSSHVVAITSGFSGASLLLFGSVDADSGGDVVIVVHGANRNELVRRRSRILGIWVNRDKAEISDAPIYYQVASTRPLEQIASNALLDRQRLGIDHLGLGVQRNDSRRSDDDYRQALIRLKQNTGLYGEQSGKINLLGGRLFRTEMTFPANVPVGIYTAEVYLVKEGEIVSAQTTPLIISKSGVGAEIFDIANRHAALYGACAVGLAMLAGWLAAEAFRRR
jgi:uncharacterized protein (TIGR02186 family)